MKKRMLEQSFSAYFNAKPQFIVRAPGRVNLIGEHTDYNDGFVLRWRLITRYGLPSLPGLTQQSTFTPSISGLILPSICIHLRKAGAGSSTSKAVAHELQGNGYELRGFNAVMTGDVPRGAGLSSSAAVELATARAFASVSSFEWDAARMAGISQKAENEWVGVNCGIMDQMASAASRRVVPCFGCVARWNISMRPS